MTALLSISACASALIFVIGCIRRVRQYANLPVHLRWELYPVPHERSDRARYGGSYFEESNWWAKPRKRNRAGEVRVMADEIFAFNSVRRSKANLWWRTLAFHVGLYCLVAFLALEVVLAFLSPAGATMEAYVAAMGRVGLVLVVSGSLSLLWRRTFNSELRDYTHVADFVHLIAIAVASTLVFAGTLSSAAPSPRDFVRDMLTFGEQTSVPVLLAVGLLLSFAVVAYVPYSHMGHFIAKYFTFHAVRWDDEPNVGDKFQRSISTSFQYKPTWWASHLGADGSRTWAEIASDDPTAVKESRP